MSKIYKDKSISEGILGPIIVILGIILLWNNEGRAAKMNYATKEARKKVIDVSSETIDYKNDNNLVAFNGSLTITGDELVDTEFNISVKAAKLSRVVEIYQWNEECETDDNDNKTCKYKKVWSDTLIDSSSFEKEGYDNPDTKVYDDLILYSDSVNVGSYIISSDLISDISTNVTYSKLDTEFAKEKGYNISSIYYTNVVDGIPKIGDFRISFKYNDAINVSVIGLQKGNTIEKYISKNGQSIYGLYEGVYTGRQMLDNMQQENNDMKVNYRFVGIFMCVVGCFTLVSPIQKLFSRVPVLNNLVDSVTSFVGFLLGIAISLIVIAIAWLVYRPLIAILCLLGVVLIIILITFYRKKKIK